MAQRITSTGVMFEYVPADVRRVTSVGLMIEYVPADRRTITSTGLMIEYTTKRGSKYGLKVGLL